MAAGETIMKQAAVTKARSARSSVARALVVFVFFVAFVALPVGAAANRSASSRSCRRSPRCCSPSAPARRSSPCQQLRRVSAGGASRCRRVGALLDPDTERILSLQPDLVITYGSQVDLQTQLKRASIPFFDYRHGGLDHIMVDDARSSAQRTGHVDRGRRRGRGRSRRASTRCKARVAGKPRPRTLLVFGREPGSLRNIYASGGRGFLHDMLVAAGGEDVFDDIGTESVQATTETILARAPDVILELRSRAHPGWASRARGRARSRGRALAAVPAVRNKRVDLPHRPAA